VLSAASPLLLRARHQRNYFAVVKTCGKRYANGDTQDRHRDVPDLPQASDSKSMQLRMHQTAAPPHELNIVACIDPQFTGRTHANQLPMSVRRQADAGFES
jgi:hypothetical protein